MIIFTLFKRRCSHVISNYHIFAVKEDAKVLIVATIAWGLRKCARPIMLLLIFLIAAKPGLVHAVYSTSKYCQ